MFCFLWCFAVGSYFNLDVNVELIRYRDCEMERLDIEQRRRELDVQAAHHEEQATNVEGDLKVEREWRISLQESMQHDRERISTLQLELTHLKAIALVRQEDWKLCQSFICVCVNEIVFSPQLCESFYFSHFLSVSALELTLVVDALGLATMLARCSFCFMFDS